MLKWFCLEFIFHFYLLTASYNILYAKVKIIKRSLTTIEEQRMNDLFEDMEEQSSNIENLEQSDLTSVASLAKKQKNQEQKVKDLEAELKKLRKSFCESVTKRSQT